MLFQGSRKEAEVYLYSSFHSCPFNSANKFSFVSTVVPKILISALHAILKQKGEGVQSPGQAS